MPSIEIEGAEVFEEELHGCNVTTVRIQSEQAAEKLGKPVGSYITIETGESLNEHTNVVDIGECLTEVLGRVMQAAAAHARRAADTAPSFETICRESEAAYAARNPHKKKEDA